MKNSRVNVLLSQNGCLLWPKPRKPTCFSAWLHKKLMFFQQHEKEVLHLEHICVYRAVVERVASEKKKSFMILWAFVWKSRLTEHVTTSSLPPCAAGEELSVNKQVLYRWMVDESSSSPQWFIWFYLYSKNMPQSSAWFRDQVGPATFNRRNPAAFQLVVRSHEHFDIVLYFSQCWSVKSISFC